MTPDQIRSRLGHALQLARADASVHASGASGVGYRTIHRIESGRKQWIDLASVYLLALHYGVGLREVLSLERTVRRRADLGGWPAAAPSLPATDEYLRQQIRTRRLDVGLGTPALAEAAHVHQSWVVRLELGSVRPDVVRIVQLAHALDLRVSDLLPEGFSQQSGGGILAAREA